MALFGSSRDVSYLRRISKELTDRVSGMEVLYYKISLNETEVDIYGDAKKRMYYSPILITCTMDRMPQENNNASYGSDTTRTIDFNFLRDDLMDINLVPEKGDIIVWNESYYEVENNPENQLVVGKDPDYSIQDDLQNYGRSWSIICNTHLVNVNKLNIVKSR